MWYPYLKRQSKIIENVQRRATKLLKPISHFSYEERLRHLNLPSLRYRRIRGDQIYVYKYLKESIDSDYNLLTLATHSQATRGHSLKLLKKCVKHDAGKYSFTNRVDNIWNNLSSNTVCTKNINDFKNLLDEELVKLKYIID